jgi:hypothetical protein
MGFRFLILTLTKQPHRGHNGAAPLPANLKISIKFHHQLLTQEVLQHKPRRPLCSHPAPSTSSGDGVYRRKIEIALLIFLTSKGDCVNFFFFTVNPSRTIIGSGNEDCTLNHRAGRAGLRGDAAHWQSIRRIRKESSAATAFW